MMQYEDCFRSLAANIGMSEKMAMSSYQKVLDRFECAINESAKELQEIGFINAGTIAERILLARKRIL